MKNEKKYDFDEIIDRKNTNALNTDGFRSYIFNAGPEKIFPFKDDEFIRMWVADMEFAVPQEICQSMINRIERRIFGYTMMFDDKYYDAFSKWCEKRYHWTFDKSELTFSTGVIPAMYELVDDILSEDEKMLILTPSYGFFKHAATYNNISLVKSKLKHQNGEFSMDFKDLARKAEDEKVRLLLFCNPHNPSGKVWSEDELKEVAKIVERNDLWVISDEIHCDLLRSEIKHIPLGKVMNSYNKLITCMSASKTFNLAGLMFSNVIIRDEELRKKFNERNKNVGMLNPISIEAHKAAYEKGESWLEELRFYLDENFRFTDEFFKKNLPDAVFKIPDATYLAWVDMSKYFEEHENLAEFFANEAGVLLEGGDELFVDNAKGFIRLNLAMPKSILAEGLKRINESIKRKFS